MNSENPNLILIKGITGLFLNRLLETKNPRIVNLVESIGEKIRMPANSYGEGSETEIANALRSTMEWLGGCPESIEVSSVDVAERVKLNCCFAGEYLDAIENLLVTDGTEDEISKRVHGIASELEYAYQKINLSATITALNRQLNFSGEYVDIKKTLEFLEEKTREIVGQTNVKDENFVGRVDFSDEESIAACFEEAKELVSHEGVLKTGLQGLNHALGVDGVPRGYNIVHAALTHNYKTGILLDYSRWLPTLNKPRLLDPKKKPMILRVSFENKPSQDLPIMYRSLWEAEHQKKLDIKEIAAKDAAKYIKEKLEVNGFHFEMVCYNPNKMDVWDLINILNGYEAEGYEIHAMICDYLELITKKGDANMRGDEKINYAFEVLRNHCFPRGIAQIHAHQLSTQAIELERECGSAGFARKVATGGYNQGSKSLTTKLDMYVTMHLHELADKTYLTASVGKNRACSEVSIRAKSFAYEFQEFGGICDDINEEHSKAIYSFSEVASEPTESMTADESEEW